MCKICAAPSRVMQIYATRTGLSTLFVPIFLRSRLRIRCLSSVTFDIFWDWRRGLLYIVGNCQLVNWLWNKHSPEVDHKNILSIFSETFANKLPILYIAINLAIPLVTLHLQGTITGFRVIFLPFCVKESKHINLKVEVDDFWNKRFCKHILYFRYFVFLCK